MTAQKRKPRAKPAPGKRTVRTKKAARRKFVAPEILDMRTVRRLKTELDEIYGAKQDCEIDARAVKQVSTGCLQLLAAFVKAMAQANLKVSFFRSSSSLTKGIEDLGLADFFAAYSKEART